MGNSATSFIARKQPAHFFSLTWTMGEKVIKRVVRRLLGIFLVILLATLAWVVLFLLLYGLWALLAFLTGH